MSGKRYPTKEGREKKKKFRYYQMKRFIGFVKKEFFHIIRDVRSMLIIIGMPIIQVLIFGYAITNEIKDIEIAIIDNAKDEVGREITQKILSSGYFLLNKNLSSYNEIEKSFRISLSDRKDVE